MDNDDRLLDIEAVLKKPKGPAGLTIHIVLNIVTIAYN